MKYRVVERKDRIAYLVSIPDNVTDNPMTIADETILELLDEIEKLKAPNTAYTKCSIELLSELKWAGNMEIDDIKLILKKHFA